MADDESALVRDERVAILIADDYPSNLTALRAVLEPLGEQVDAVGSGAMVLTAMRRRDYAIVILDVQMPPMDGPEVAKRIRSGGRNAAVPIIFLTAVDADVPQVLDAYASGAVDFLQKPFDPRILRSKVSIFVELYRRVEEIKRATAARIREEEARAAAERASHEKDEFLSVLGHELRTPLTTILLWAERLVNGRLSTAALDRAYDAIHRSARAEAHMVENVLEMSHIVTRTLALERRGTNLSQLVAAVVAEVAREAAQEKVTICWQPSGDQYMVPGDAHRLRIVVYNLVSNAVKFAPGGRVEISLTREEASVTMKISDTGIGFRSGTERDLFRAFRQENSSTNRPHGGLGLGLAVVKGIVEHHGGSITAHTAGTGRGASFVVRLPAGADDRNEDEPALVP